MEAIAKIKMKRISARKARLVGDMIRMKTISSALAILENTNKKASKILIALINSAISNAVNNHGMSANKLFISDVTINEGPTLKRFKTRSQGRADQILKRTSHMSITVSDETVKLTNKKVK